MRRSRMSAKHWRKRSTSIGRPRPKANGAVPTRSTADGLRPPLRPAISARSSMPLPRASICAAARSAFSAYFRALQTYRRRASARRHRGRRSRRMPVGTQRARSPQGSSDDLTPDARTIVGDLDRAIALDPNDAGAHHLRIHFWEQAHHPERALPDADYLRLVDLRSGGIASAAHGRTHLRPHRRLRSNDRSQRRRLCQRRRLFRARQRRRREIHAHLPRARRGFRAVRLDHGRTRCRGPRFRRTRVGQQLANIWLQRMHDNRLVLELLGARSRRCA